MHAHRRRGSEVVDPFLTAARRPWRGTGPHHLELSSRLHHARDWTKTVFQTLSIEMKAHAGRIWTPSGTMPSCARRQSAINSLRARARSASCATGGLEIAVADM